MVQGTSSAALLPSECGQPAPSSPTGGRGARPCDDDLSAARTLSTCEVNVKVPARTPSRLPSLPTATRFAGTRPCTQGEGGIAVGGRDGTGSGVALDGAAAQGIGASLKMAKVLKVLKVLNF